MLGEVTLNIQQELQCTAKKIVGPDTLALIGSYNFIFAVLQFLGITKGYMLTTILPQYRRLSLELNVVDQWIEGAVLSI